MLEQIDISHVLYTRGLPIAPSIRAKATQAAALATKELLQSHLQSLPGKSFYKQAANSVSCVPSAYGSFSVNISHPGIALQFYGGTIRPTGRISPITGRPTRALLIPLSHSSFFRLSSSVNTFTIRSRAGSLLLVSKNSPSASLTPLALLRKSATIKPHPQILPSQELIKSTAAKAASAKIAQILSNTSL